MWAVKCAAQWGKTARKEMRGKWVRGNKKRAAEWRRARWSRLKEEWRVSHCAQLIDWVRLMWLWGPWSAIYHTLPSTLSTTIHTHCRGTAMLGDSRLATDTCSAAHVHAPTKKKKKHKAHTLAGKRGRIHTEILCVSALFTSTCSGSRRRKQPAAVIWCHATNDDISVWTS